MNSEELTIHEARKIIRENDITQMKAIHDKMENYIYTNYPELVEDFNNILKHLENGNTLISIFVPVLNYKFDDDNIELIRKFCEKYHGKDFYFSIEDDFVFTKEDGKLYSNKIDRVREYRKFFDDEINKRRSEVSKKLEEFNSFLEGLLFSPLTLRDIDIDYHKFKREMREKNHERFIKITYLYINLENPSLLIFLKYLELSKF